MKKIKFVMFFAALMISLFTFSAKIFAADQVNDYSTINNKTVKNILVSNDQILAQCLALSTKAIKDGDSLKIIILADGQIKNDQAMGDLANKAFDSNALKKFFIGPNYTSLDAFNQSDLYTSGRIEQMNQLKAELQKVESAEVATEYGSYVDKLTKNNQDLISIIDKQENSFSMFGWLIKMFQK